jgi:CO/xanthine dehydrogenase FAD-binding subunit
METRQPPRDGRMEAIMYLRPRCLDEAVDVLALDGARILSGGTDFYPGLGDGVAGGVVVDISGVDGLVGIAVTPDEVRIGARTTWSAIAAASLPSAFDALRAAAREVGSVQIQNLGTVGGNLCNASPAADGVPPLLALDAEVELRSRSGSRRLALADFITGYRETALRPGELLASIVIPRSIEGRSSFLKLGARRYLVISIAMVAAVAEADADGRIAQARVAVGACSAVAQRLRSLEDALVGAPAATGVGALAGPEHLAALSPIDDVRATAGYRRDAALTLVRRALENCVAEA